MSEPTEKQALPKLDATAAAAAKPKKPAAKKVAKKAAKKATKKVAVKKASEASVKVKAKTVLVDSAATPSPVAQPAPAPTPAAPPALVPVEASSRPPQEHRPRRGDGDDGAQPPKRFGRVPGGGPLVNRGQEGDGGNAERSAERPAQNESRSEQGRSEQGRSEQGRSEQGRSEQGRSEQGRSEQGRSEQGRSEQGRSEQGRSEQGRSEQGRSEQGRSEQGRSAQGRSEQGRSEQGDSPEGRERRRRDKRRRRVKQRRDDGGEPQDDNQSRQAPKIDGPKIECNGMLELAPKGFGFLRVPTKNFEQARDDVFVSPEFIRKFNLRLGQWIHGLYQDGPRGPQLVEIGKINDMTVEEANKLPHFDELKAINPTKRISFETTPDRYTTRVVDIMAPVGKGQRGLIVSPPRSGKTTLLLHMAEAIREKYDETMHLMVLLVDERPEEVTEFRRALPEAEIYASSNDEQARNHCRIAELAIERAKRLVEAGKDVFLLMDSITRLARAYNNSMSSGGGMGHKGNRNRGIGSGGITIGALEVPRRLFAAARNTRGGGSLTILATALIQTNSRADDAIFMEFKGTGNMELVLDRKIAENYIYPAVDIFKSGTRREELLLPDHMLHKIHLIRRGLSGHRPVEAMERLLFFLKKFPNNPQMLMEIKG